MSVLTKVFGRKKVEVVHAPCPHTALAPRWANAADMGKPERVSSYLCTACGELFDREEASALPRLRLST